VRITAVIQARMGSTRLPGKTLALIGGRPLIFWTIRALEAVPGIDHLIVATTTEPLDDELVAALDGRVAVHRGSVHDVLSRVWDAASPSEPDLVVRETADNPFGDPAILEAQIERCRDGGFDYVGPAGWPLGLAAEVARASALEYAYRHATGAAEREHVMPYLYTHPERFRVGALAPVTPPPEGRFTVDTAEDLAFVRALAVRLGDVEYATLEGLRAVIDAEPGLLAINADVRQKTWQEAERP
jgi:spore coat polysaccharide biosynthesis protein SpsF